MIAGLLTAKYWKMQIFTKINRFVKICFTDKYLLYTNMTISFCLSGTGDVIEQRYEILTENLEEWNLKRTLNMSTTGISVGIICHYWYKFLDRSLQGNAIRIVMKKILLDQLIGSPACILTFFGTLAVLEKTTYNQFIDEVKTKWWRLYVAEWIVWPTAQFINFYFLPTKYRVLYDNTISLGYDVYTSHVANFDKNKKQSKGS